MNMMVRTADIARWPSDPKVVQTGRSSLTEAVRMARGLGWFSIGLGVFELFGARSLARTLGFRGSEWLIRGYGLREVASGVACLSINPGPGVASRITGDALDIVTLAALSRPDNPKKRNVELALLAVLGVTLLDMLCQADVSIRHSRGRSSSHDYSDRSGLPRRLKDLRTELDSV
jgi:hypothetical protein